MDGKDKSNLNQIILLLLVPPYYFIIVNIALSLLGWVPTSRSIHPDGLVLYNVHHPWWTVLWIIPYIILYAFRHNSEIWPLTKFLSALTMLVGVIHPIIKTYNWVDTTVLMIVTVCFSWLILRKDVIEERDKLGEYSLAFDPERKEPIPTDCFNENTQIIGSTGSGKTYHVIKPLIEQTIRQKLGCLVLDVKSNLYKDVMYYAEKADRIDAVQYFDLAHPEFSDTYNPLHGDNTDDIANRVHTALYCDFTGEPYYKEMANAFLSNLVGLLKMEIKTITFQDLATATGELTTFKTISGFCARHKETRYAQYFQSLWLDMPIRERQTSLTGLLNKLQRFCTREWSPLINVKNPTIRMGDVLSEGKVFIFGTHSMKYSEDAKPLAVMAMMDLSSHIADRFLYPAQEPFRVFLDEFYNIAYPGFINLINKCRETKVNLFLAHQSLGDLRGVSEEFQEQVMNTARNKVILGVDDPNTAERFSRLLGTEPDLDARVVSYDANDNVAGISVPQMEKFRFHPNEIKEMPVGEAIIRMVSRRGAKTFRTALGTASQVPEDFQPFLDRQTVKTRDRRNETSLIITHQQTIEKSKSEQVTSVMRG